MEIAGLSVKDATDLLAMLRLYQQGRLLPNQVAGREVQLGMQPVYVKNGANEEVPAFACMKVTGTVAEGGKTYVTIAKPTSDLFGLDGPFLFNSRTPIATGSYGVSQGGVVVQAKIGTPTGSVGDSLIAQSGSWELKYDSALPGLFRRYGADTTTGETGTIAKVVNTTLPGEFLEVITDLRVNNSSKTLQKKTRNILVCWEGPESDWSTWHTGEECSPP